MSPTSADIRKCARELIACLQEMPELNGKDWTDENFRRLKAFADSKSSGLMSYYGNLGRTREFLWDFIAVGDSGIFLAAESEQSAKDGNIQHDFEKLLYVYSPIRILIAKAKDREHAQEQADKLASHAKGCCLTFNPGASFVLHFCLNNARPVSYHWQSKGEPSALKPEQIAFKLVKQSSHLNPFSL